MTDHTPWVALGERLRTARRRAWLSQSDVARQVGISQGAYCQVEQGRIRPRLVHLRQMAALFDLPLIQLLTLAQYEPDAFVQSVAMELAAGG